MFNVQKAALLCCGAEELNNFSHRISVNYTSNESYNSR
jgi:hypothetical protein